MKRRPAFTMLECIVALAILALGFVLMTEGLAACAESRRASQIMLAAQLEASNIAERIAAMTYDEVTESSMDAIKLSSSLQASLLDAKLHVGVVSSSPSDLPHKRITIDIHWSAPDEAAVGVSLTTWKYPASAEVRR